MDSQKLIDEFLVNFKPKENQSWKSCYFFCYFLKKNHNIDSELIEGITRINKIDYWLVRLNNSDIDIHAKAVGLDEDYIDKPEVIWSLEEFEKDNF